MLSCDHYLHRLTNLEKSYYQTILVLLQELIYFFFHDGDTNVVMYFSYKTLISQVIS